MRARADSLRRTNVSDTAKDVPANPHRLRRTRTRPTLPPVLVVAAAFVLVASGCASTKHRASPTTSVHALRQVRTDVPPVAPVQWHDCDGFQCGSLVVPLDYRHPTGATITLALTRRPADNPAQRVGTLMFDPGGPGEGAGGALRVLGSMFPATILQRFDIVAMDRRGTGGSGKVDCGPTPAEVASAPLNANGQAQLLARYRQTLVACRQSQARVGTADTVTAARDLDRTRQALGEPRLNFWGLSYGTLLGNVYAQLFPSHIRAMVLDGAVDPAQSLLSQTHDMAPAAETALAHLLDSCKTQGAACPLGPDPSATYNGLKARLEATPLPAPGNGDDLPVTDGDLAAAALTAITLPTLLGSGFLTAVAAANNGDGSKLRSVATTLYIDDDGSSVIGPYWTTTCDDTPERPSASQIHADANSLAAKYPNQGREAVSYLLPGCVGWPNPPEPLPTARISGAPAIVVLAGVNDPQTPLPWARRVTAQLGASGHLVVHQGDGHTALLNGISPCVSELVDNYLTVGAVPPAETNCPG